MLHWIYFEVKALKSRAGRPAIRSTVPMTRPSAPALIATSMAASTCANSAGIPWAANADEIRDDVRRYVTDAFADPHAILVVDVTGDLEKGTKTVGVQRQ